MNNLFQFPREVSGIQPPVVFSIGGFPISNSTMFLIVIAIIILFFSLVPVKKFKINPISKFQSLIEMTYEGLISLITQITGNKSRSEKIFPIIASLFIFIGLSNLAGLLPVVGSFTFNGNSILRTPTADFNTTFALAVGSIILIQLTSIKEWGIIDHINKYIKFKDVYFAFKKGFGAGMMSLVDFFIGLLDIIGELAKIVSLSLRLFGNMYAGEVLMTILIGSFAYIIPSAWLAMSLLSAVVQTVVFGSLVTVFYMLAIKKEQNININS